MAKVKANECQCLFLKRNIEKCNFCKYLQDSIFLLNYGFIKNMDF